MSSPAVLTGSAARRAGAPERACPTLIMSSPAVLPGSAARRAGATERACPLSHHEFSSLPRRLCSKKSWSNRKSLSHSHHEFSSRPPRLCSKKRWSGRKSLSTLSSRVLQPSSPALQQEEMERQKEPVHSLIMSSPAVLTSSAARRDGAAERACPLSHHEFSSRPHRLCSKKRWSGRKSLSTLSS